MSTAAAGIYEAVTILADDLEDNLAGLDVVRFDRVNQPAPYVLVGINGAQANPTDYELPVHVVVDAVETVSAQEQAARLADLIDKSLDQGGYGPAEFTVEFDEGRGAWVVTWRVSVPRSW